MSITINFDSNLSKIQIEENEKKEAILYAIGLKWQSIATKLITTLNIIDTGRLRGSLTFTTYKKTGGPSNRVAANKSSDYIKGSTDKDSLIVGSNVEYAAAQEANNKKGPFLRPSILDYRESYKKIAENIFKN